jgi:hypothetical protein
MPHTSVAVNHFDALFQECGSPVVQPPALLLFLTPLRPITIHLLPPSPAAFLSLSLAACVIR